MSNNEQGPIVTEKSGGNACNRCVECGIKEFHIIKLTDLLRTLEGLLEMFEERGQISAALLAVDRRLESLRDDERRNRDILSEDYYKDQLSQIPEGPPF